MTNRKSIAWIVGILLFVMIAIIALVIVFTLTSSRATKPFNITVAFGNDVYTEKNFTWHTLKDYPYGTLYYMEDKGEDFDLALCELVEAESEYIYRKYPKDLNEPSSSELVYKPFYRHRVFVSNLKADTKYLYKVGYGKDLSPVYRFKTPVESDELSFIVVADSQGYTKADYEYYTTVLKKANRMYPDVDFYLHLGDFVEVDENSYQWEQAINMPRSIMANNTFLPVAGNRDNFELYDYFTLGNALDTRPLVNGYFSFDFNGIHFVVLNTASKNELSNKQYNFLANDLEANQGKRIILLTHRGPYANANHADDKVIVELRKDILPLCDRYGVSLVLQGHDHFLFRSEPIYQNEIGTYNFEELIDNAGNRMESFSNVKGTIFYTNSSSGVGQHDKGFRDMPEIYAIRSERLKNPTFTYCNINKSVIELTTYEVNVLKGTIEVIDAFCIVS